MTPTTQGMGATALPGRADVVVIGGGVHGLSAAYNLARLGREVILLERGRLGQGNTSKSGAIIRQHYTTEPLIQAASLSRQLWEQMSDEFGEDVGFTQNGYLFLATEEEREVLEDVVRLQRRHGIDAELLSLTAVRDLVPGINLNGVAAASIEHDSGYGNPDLTVRAFARKASELGAVIHEHSPVDGLERLPSGGFRVWQADRSITCRDVINAAGPWVTSVAEMVGVRLPITFRRVQEVCLTPAQPYEKTSPTIHDDVRAVYFRPDAGRITGGGLIGTDTTPYDGPDSYSERADDLYVSGFAEAVEDLLPFTVPCRLTRGWAGMGPFTPDSQPILGSIPDCPGFHVICDSCHGFKFAPLWGRLVAEVIVWGHGKTMDISPFSIDRFASGATLATRYGRFPWF